MNYERKSDWTFGENKPNSKPIKANLHFTAENAEYAEKKDISVSDCSVTAIESVAPNSDALAKELPSTCLHRLMNTRHHQMLS